MTDFVPALSLSEAEARITGIVGSAVQSRGPKRTLRALADALGLDVPLHVTNGTLGGEIADALGSTWPDGAATDSDQITLLGLNTLLEAAYGYYSTHTPPRPQALPEQFADPSWSWFIPARSKIEAVNRISNLTGSGREVLGPGGKERKSVFENLAVRGGIGVDASLSKVDLGAALADALGVTWTPTCASTGYTITLEGLNVVLAGAERHFGGRAAAPDARREAGLLVALLANEFSDGPWDGREKVLEMRDDGYSQWRQMEWPGFYFEYRGLRALHSGMGHRTWSTPPQKYGVTVFDYTHHFVWDLKAHTEAVRGEPSGEVSRGRDGAPLNDKESTDLCAADTGMGLLILNGGAVIDETGEFDEWHRKVTSAGRRGASRASPAAKNRRSRKAAFTPTSIESFRWEDLAAVNAAVAAGALSVMAQGRQPSGEPRPPKYTLRSSRASTWLLDNITISPL